MTFPSSTHSNARGQLLRVAAIAWFVFISAAVVINHVALSRLTDDLQATTLESRLTLLDQRLSEMAQQIEPTQNQPIPPTLADLETIRQSLEERLTALEQLVSTHVALADLTQLESRLDQFEVHLQETRQAPPPAAPPTRRPTPAKPTITEPPFQVLSIELRGGERFLSIAPTDPHSLAEARVIRPGEIVSGWLLEAVDGNAAIFRVDGQTRQLTVP